MACLYKRSGNGKSGNLNTFNTNGLSLDPKLGGLSNDVFERRKSTGSGLIAFLGSDFDQFFGQIVSLRVKSLSNTNFVASRHIRILERNRTHFSWCASQRTSLAKLANEKKNLLIYPSHPVVAAKLVLTLYICKPIG